MCIKVWVPGSNTGSSGMVVNISYIRRNLMHPSVRILQQNLLFMLQTKVIWGTVNFSICSAQIFLPTSSTSGNVSLDKMQPKEITIRSSITGRRARYYNGDTTVGE